MTVPVWSLFKLLMAPFRTPIQNLHTGAPFKREPLVIGKQSRHQNNQDINMSSMVSRSALYDHPVWPPFKPLTASFKTPIQDPCSKPPFRIPCSKEIASPYSDHKIHQSVQLNKQRKMHPLRPPEHS